MSWILLIVLSNLQVGNHFTSKFIDLSVLSCKKVSSNLLLKELERWFVYFYNISNSTPYSIITILLDYSQHYK